jgi:hypothetical protein
MESIQPFTVPVSQNPSPVFVGKGVLKMYTPSGAAFTGETLATVGRTNTVLTSNVAIERKRFMWSL